jgi:hypothetical protein
MKIQVQDNKTGIIKDMEIGIAQIENSQCRCGRLLGKIGKNGKSGHSHKELMRCTFLMNIELYQIYKRVADAQKQAEAALKMVSEYPKSKLTQEIEIHAVNPSGKESDSQPLEVDALVSHKPQVKHSKKI